jgi:hypothetical protein
VPLFATSGVLAGESRLALPAGPERIEAIGPALSPQRAGYRAMRLALDAVRAGQCNRRRVVSAALRLAPSAGDSRLAVYRPGADGRFERVGVAR